MQQDYAYVGGGFDTPSERLGHVPTGPLGGDTTPPVTLAQIPPTVGSIGNWWDSSNNLLYGLDSGSSQPGIQSAPTVGDGAGIGNWWSNPVAGLPSDLFSPPTATPDTSSPALAAPIDTTPGAVPLANIPPMQGQTLDPIVNYAAPTSAPPDQTTNGNWWTNYTDAQSYATPATPTGADPNSSFNWGLYSTYDPGPAPSTPWATIDSSTATQSTLSPSWSVPYQSYDVTSDLTSVNGSAYSYTASSLNWGTPSSTGFGSYTDYSYGISSTTTSTFQWSPSYSYGLDDFYPVVLDLTGGGIKITQLSSSNDFFDTAGDSLQHKTAWAGAGNGVLALDANHDGLINQTNEIEFTQWDPTATSDMQALLDVFDTNHNGLLDSGDTRWSDFRVVVTNADGTTTLDTLAQLNITSINLTTNNQAIQLPDGSSIHGKTTYTKGDGSTGTAADVSFASDSTGYVLQQTTTHNADGSTTIDSKSSFADNSLASETTSTTSADGKTITLLQDTNGDGVTDSRQTDATVVNGDGSTSETLSNYNGSGALLLNRTVTTTSADHKTVTINRDSRGNGFADQTETDVIAADGSLTVTVTDLNPDSSVKDKSVTATSGDGLSKTIQTWLTNGSSPNATETDAISYAANGTKTETVTDYAGSSTASANKISQTITVTSADHQSQIVTTDKNGDGTVDVTASNAIVTNADGSKTITQTESNPDSSLRDKTVTTISADGLTKTIQTDSNGDGVFEATSVDATVFNANGSKTETVTTTSANSALLNKTITTTSADGRSRNVAVDSNGDSVADQTTAVVVNGDNSSTSTVTSVAPNATTLGTSVSNTSADGLTVTVQSDVDGNGVTDREQVTVTVHNANGSSTVTQTDLNGAGTVQIDKTVTTTSADGLSVTTNVYFDNHTSADQVETTATVLNGDGSRTVTVTDYAGSNQVQTGKTVTTTSADRKTVTGQDYLDSNASPDKVHTTVVNTNGSTTDTTISYSGDGSIQLDKQATTTSADGLSVTTQRFSNGSTTVTATTTDVTALNADGSRAETVTNDAGSGTTSANETSQTVTTTSGNGYSKTTQSDLDGNGSFDATRTDVTVLNADGSQTETITDTNNNGSLKDKTVTTTSASGLSVTTQTDADGNGTFDTTKTDVTVLNSDGSRTETVSDLNANNSLRDKTITTTSADGNTVTINRDINGDGVTDQTENDVLNAAGSHVGTISDLLANGALADKVVITTTGNSLSITTQRDTTGAGSFNETTTDVTAVNADGSRTETTTWLNANGSLHDKTVVTTSADGLSTTTQQDSFGAGTYNLTESDVNILNLDGSRTETVTYDNSNGALHYKTVTTTSADQTSVTVARDINGDGVNDRTVSTVVGSNGAVTVTESDLNANGSLKDKTVKTTTASGLSITSQFDSNGDGTFDGSRTDVTVINSDGSRVRTISDLNASGALKDKSITTTSANGFNQTLQYDNNGDGTFDGSRTDVTAINSDGSTTETVSNLAANGSLKSRQAVTTSATGLSTTKQWDTTGSGSFDQTMTDVTVLNADGTKTDTTSANKSGALFSRWVASTSANGLSETVTCDTNGDGTTDQSWTRTTRNNADGSKSVAVTDFNGNGSTRDSTVTSTSADGRTVSITRDIDGNGTTDQSETDVNVPDGSKVRTVSNLGAGSTLLEKTIVTTSADGLTTTTQWDLDGNGTIDRTQADVVVQNADGSRTETITSRNSDNSLRQKTVITTSDDGLTTNVQKDKRGSGSTDHTELTTVNADGSKTTDTKNYSSTGGLLDETKITVSADGLTQTVSKDTGGTGTFNYNETTQTNVDGSKTSTGSFTTNGSVTQRIVTAVSADGLITTIKTDSTNSGWYDSIETRVTRIDGSIVSTLQLMNQNGTVSQTAIVTTSADGRVLSGTGADLATYLTPGRLSQLAENTDLEYIDATDDTLNLSLTQYLSLGALKLTQADTVTVSDTGANLASLSYAQFSALIGAGVDHLNATDNYISLAPIKYHASPGFTANTHVQIPTVVNDFNGDGLSDVLWRQANGQLLLADWSMNGATINSSMYLTSQGSNVAPASNWVVSGISDFDGNGTADVFWTDTNTGERVIWGMNGSSVAWSGDIYSNGSPIYLAYPWVAIATGDFDGNGTADIFWRNANTGETAIWGMSGNVISWSGDVITPWGSAAYMGSQYSLLGIGNFDGNATSDTLWRDNNTGEVWIWGMSGNQVSWSADLNSGGQQVYTGNTLVGIGDFNGDGKADILWRDSSNRIIEWQMNSATIVSSNYVTYQGSNPAPDSSWHPVEIGDFNGDNKSDILWRNDSGQLAEWLMNGAVLTQTVAPNQGGTPVQPDWSLLTMAKPQNFG